MRNQYLTLLFIIGIILPSFSQTIISVNQLSSLTKAEVSLMIGGIQPRNGVDVYHIIYNTPAPDGSTTIASGALYIPNDNPCTSFPLVSYQHGTVLNKNAVPSRGNDLGGLLASAFGYVTSAPDYLGLGDSPGLHPYMHAESEATASIDLMRAARTYINDSLTIQLNGEVLLTGYSQGGHATMALHKYIEDNNLLSEFDVIASAPLSGPYNMSGVQSEIPADSLYSNPAYYPYVIESYQSVYGTIYNSPSEVYKAPYDTLIFTYLDGTYGIGDLNAALPPNVYDFMQDSFMQSFLTDTLGLSHPFRMALQLNDNHDWTPNRPVRMVYCDADEQVFYQNALVALANMQANGATDVAAVHALTGGTHGSCVIPAFFYTVSWFDSLSSVCFPVATEWQSLDDEVTIYPNPTQDNLTIDINGITTSQPLQLEVLSMDGRLVKRIMLEQNKSQYQISLGNYEKGMYLLRIGNEEVQVRKKVVVY